MFPSTLGFVVSYKFAAAKLTQHDDSVSGPLVLSATTAYVKERPMGDMIRTGPPGLLRTARVEADDLMLTADPDSQSSTSLPEPVKLQTLYLNCILKALKRQDISIDPADGPATGTGGDMLAADKPYTLLMLLHSALMITNTRALSPQLHEPVEPM